MWKTVEEMTLAECEDTKDSLERYFESCQRIGQGINSKETVRYRRACERIERETGKPVERWF